MDYSTALSNFLSALTARELVHNKTDFPTLTPAVFSVNPGRVFDKIVTTRHGQRSVYAFVRRSDGAIVKAATWKAPEPKKRERGNIYNDNPLAGTGVYGVNYINDKLNSFN